MFHLTDSKQEELLRRIAVALEERNVIEREKIGMTPVARTSAVRMAEVFTADPDDMADGIDFDIDGGFGSEGR